MSRRFLALLGTVVLVSTTLALPAVASATPTPASTSVASRSAPKAATVIPMCTTRASASPNNCTPPPYHFDPKHPCRDLTMNTKITSKMMTKVGNCSAIQAHPGKSPSHSTRFSCAPKCEFATGSGASRMSISVVQEPDGLYKECLKTAYSNVFYFGRLQQASMCRRVSASHNYPWFFPAHSVNGMNWAKASAAQAKKFDKALIARIKKQEREGGSNDDKEILGACTGGAIGGVIASAPSGPGMILGATGGCVGGALTVIFSNL